jgi:hypothetical protein
MTPFSKATEVYIGGADSPEVWAAVEAAQAAPEQASPTDDFWRGVAFGLAIGTALWMLIAGVVLLVVAL